MQPCSREMQGMNSLLNPPQISLQDIQNNHNQLPHIQNSHFDPTANDDFLEQMFSSLPSSCSWVDLNPTTNPMMPMSLNPNNPRDLSDESTPSGPENVGFHFDEAAILASKLRHHQISGGSPAAAVAAAKMLQQQLLMSGDAGMVPMPLSLAGGDFDRSQNDTVDGSSFKSRNPGGEGSIQGLFKGFAGAASDQAQHFHHPQQGVNMQAQNFGATGATMNQSPASGSTGGAPAQPRQRVRARRGQATDPHSIAERLRRERIAERMKALQELVPNANKTDKASMLDEIIDYVKFLQLQVKVLSMGRLGGAAAVAPLVADMSSEGGGDCGEASGNGGSLGRSSNDGLTVTEHQVAKLMEEDMGSAMQYLQGKGLCLMPISLATAISTATCHPRNPMINNNPLVMASNGQGPSSPSISVLTVQSATVGNGGGVDGSVKDNASISKP